MIFVIPKTCSKQKKKLWWIIHIAFSLLSIPLIMLCIKLHTILTLIEQYMTQQGV